MNDQLERIIKNNEFNITILKEIVGVLNDTDYDAYFDEDWE